MTLANDQGTQTVQKPWLAYYDPGVPHEIDTSDQVLTDFLAHTAKTYPDRPATVFIGATITFADLADKVDRFAGALAELGVRKGDRVALQLPNMPGMVIAFYATMRLGAIVVPTNPLYKANEIAHQLKDSGSETLVTLDLLYATAKQGAEGTPVKRIIVASVAEFIDESIVPFFVAQMEKDGTPLPDLSAEPVHRMGEMLTHAPYTEPTPLVPDDLAVLQYTGGTTGVSKGAMLSHRNLVANSKQAWEWSGEDVKRRTREEGGSTLAIAPLFHVYGLTVCMNASIYAGGCMLLIPRFVAQDMLNAVRQYRPAIFPGVPTMYMALAQLPDLKPEDCSSLEVCVSGSAPLQREVQDAFLEKTGVLVVEGYGLTEASPSTHANPLRRNKPGTIGLPMSSTESAIIDANTGELLGPGGIGEIGIRGPQVMQGYWQRPDETAKVIKNGWLLTGDIGTMDEEGYFTILDRSKDIIIAGGYNIYPREVEEVLFTHPAVLEAAVVGIKDTYRGETVKAFVVLKPEATATEKEIISFARANMAIFKAPTAVEFRAELPKTAVGKVLRRELAKGQA